MNSPSSANQSGIGRSPWLAAAVVGVVGFVVFQFWGNAVRGYIDTSSVFWWWGWQWFNPASESQHGSLVLGVAVWLAWRNWVKAGVRSEKAEVGVVWPGVIAMFAGLGIHLLGYAVQQTRISILAVMVFAWGVMRLGGGARWGNAVIFPLGLLIFAVPVGVLDSVGFHLRLGVIATTEMIAGLAGIELVRNGTQLFSPDGSYQYDVAAACSGMRSLMAMLALSAIMGYIGPRAWWRRSVVFLLAFPLTFVGNVVRISAIVFAGEWFGQGAGELVHDWAGFIVFVIVLGGVQWASNTLEESDRSPTSSESETPQESNPIGYFGRMHSLRFAVLVVGLGGLGTIGLIERLEALGRTAQAGVVLAEDGLNPASLPKFIGTDWIGREAEVTAVERELLPPDTGYARKLYVSLDDQREQVFVSIVLSGADRTSIHRPELCLVGQGWSIDAQARTEINGEIPAVLLGLTREVMAPDQGTIRVPALFAYWFVGREKVVATTWQRLWHTAMNRLRLKPDRWAYVVVQTAVLPDESEEMAQRRMERVAKALRDQLTPVRGEFLEKD
ncbi:EpsI family protein [Opitutaceae bacterium]|nr:EpsI family protein [Opitutaceae bacterium]